MVHNTEIGVVINQAEIAQGMGAWYDQNIDRLAFRLELATDRYGDEKIYWHGRVDGEPQTFDVEPYTGFWQRFGIGFMSILPIESQL